MKKIIAILFIRLTSIFRQPQFASFYPNLVEAYRQTPNGHSPNFRFSADKSRQRNATLLREDDGIAPKLVYLDSKSVMLDDQSMLKGK